ncbi:MAG: FeoB small GTPase domain-containing protein [Candidatus Brocadiia bacterium]
MLVLLMGNPNVGKSAIFSRLTGADVIASNYPGTTVEYTKGKMEIEGEKTEVIDVPGTYTLEPSSRAEEVAVEMTREADIIINVVDAASIERDLNLTVQLLRTSSRVIVALNMWDEAVAKGVQIDVDRLEAELGVPVVPTCALSGQGLKELRRRLPEAQARNMKFEDENKWYVIGEILDSTLTITHRHPTFREKLSHASVHPFWGLVFALVVLAVSFEIVRLVGEGVISYAADPLFDTVWRPVVQWISHLLGESGFWHSLLIGTLFEGKVDWGQSFGVLTTGLYIPVAQVLPYVFAFYFILSILEDVGYLPRLGVVIDNLMHRVGLHGLSVVPMLLGLGCNVPGALALRVLETRKERFIAGTLMAICIPCMAQIAMIAGLLGQYGVRGFLPVFGTLFLLWLVLGIIMKRYVKGETPEILVEIPPYRFPYWKSLLKKLWMRVRWFLQEAIPYVLLGVVIINLLYVLGIIDVLSRAIGPAITRVLGLPPGAVGALIMGFLRKDIAVGMLRPLSLNLRQLIVASVVLAAYFPCAATFVVLFKELGLKDMAKSALIMIFVAFTTGGLLNLLLKAVGI